MAMHGKVVIIFGGASGIGLATAKLIASRGATICIADLNPLSLEDAAYFTAHTTPVIQSTIDVAKAIEVQACIDAVIQTFGKLDGAANCAGVIGKAHGLTKITELEDDEWDRIIRVNLTGTMNCLRAELKVIENGGSIVNVSSIQGVMGFAGSAAYGASKHGVIGLTRSVAKEFGDREIRVNAVAPGSIMTPLLQQAQAVNPSEGIGPTALERIGTAEEIAGIIAFLLGPESTFTTGSVYGGDGGWNC